MTWLYQTYANSSIAVSKNIDAIVNNGDGFVFSQILKGKKGQRYNEKLFNEGGWTSNEGGTYRSKLFEDEYEGKDEDGKKVIRTRKVLLYWSKAEANIARRKREEKLEKAARSVKNNAYGIKKGLTNTQKKIACRSVWTGISDRFQSESVINLNRI